MIDVWEYKKIGGAKVVTIGDIACGTVM